MMMDQETFLFRLKSTTLQSRGCMRGMRMWKAVQTIVSSGDVCGHRLGLGDGKYPSFLFIYIYEY